MYIDLFHPGNLATLILTFIAGILVAKFFKSRGIGGCLVYLVSLVVVILLVFTLWKGYSYFIERITFNLETYIYSNIAGLIGFVFGFLLGLVIFRSSK
jgi:hypothetical protein